MLMTHGALSGSLIGSGLAVPQIACNRMRQSAHCGRISVDILPHVRTDNGIRPPLARCAPSPDAKRLAGLRQILTFCRAAFY